MEDKMDNKHIYIAIDLKSFYASVECVERSLDPLTTNLVVADSSRTSKTICLAVSPSLKAYGIPGRPRLFEVIRDVEKINKERLSVALSSGKLKCSKKEDATFTSSSFDANALKKDPTLELSYITAPPQMLLYEQYSTKIYSIYMKYVAPEDIHVYSVDEVFMDVTHYLNTYSMTPHELAMTMIREVLYTTGITATAGIGTNLYLAKVAMDIVAKHVPADKDGVRIAELDEMSYRRLLWTHRPLTDFWRVGRGISRKLESYGMYTMGDVARCSIGSSTDIYNEDLLYKLFGINAELLIDHAWGYEPVEIKDIKSYRPVRNSISSGQVLEAPYVFEKGRLIVREMVELLVLDLVKKNLVTNQLVLTIGYDRESLSKANEEKYKYTGPTTLDHYGRLIPKHAHGTANLDGYSSSTWKIMDAVIKLYNEIVDEHLLIRRINISACNVILEENLPEKAPVQLNLFTDFPELDEEAYTSKQKEEQEKRLQNAMLEIQGRFGKNAILKGTNLEEGATTIKRNAQIGGHRA